MVVGKSKTYLSNRFFVLGGLWQLFGIVSLVFPALLPFYIVAIPLLILVAAIDRASLPSKKSFKLKLNAPSSVPLHEDVSFELHAKTDLSDLGLANSLMLRAPKTNLIDWHQMYSAFTQQKAGTATNVSCVLASKFKGKARTLGFLDIDHVVIEARSRIGLWTGVLDLTIEPMEMRIVPPLKRMPDQEFKELVSQNQRLFQGSHVVMRDRSADQYYSSRDYSYPDSIRQIDHKKTAKFGSLMTKVYETVHNHNLVILLDLGRSMCGRFGRSEKHDYYLCASLALAQSALSQNDTVSFLAFSESPHLQITKARSPAAFAQIYRGGPALIARETASRYDLISGMLGNISSTRSIVVVFSDLSQPYVQDSLRIHLSPLYQKHLVVVVSLIDSRYDIYTLVNEYSDTKMSKEQAVQYLYSYWLNEQFRIFSKGLSASGAGSFLLPERYWMDSVVKLYSLLRQSLRA